MADEIKEETHDYECDDCGEIYDDETEEPKECDECFGTSFTQLERSGIDDEE